MIKQMLEYVDIDNQRTTRTVMFNLTQFEIEGEMELEVIHDRFQKFQDEVIGKNPNAPLREMTGPEKREILGMVKTLVQHSYGKREGKRFIKSQEVWDEFEQTGAFSAFLYWLFEKPERANGFMAGIWPQGVDRPEDEPRPDLKVVGQGQVIEDTPDETPSIEGPVVEENSEEKPWHQYTQQEMDSLSDEDFDLLVRRSTRGNNVPGPLLVIGQKRKSGGRAE